jgi:predicted lipid-binding transport protein (Tim44 family)
MPDSQTLGLVIAASLAVLVALRLYWVLGRRTGHEPQPRDASAPAPSALAPPAPPVHAPSAGGLVEIQLADRSFDTAKFLAGARVAYNQIVAAFAKGDRAALRPLLSPDVFAAFDAEIGGRTAPPPALVTLQDARIVNAVLEGRHAEITVAFTAEFDAKSGGGPVTDVWTFARDVQASDPNWALVATAGNLPE